MSDSGRSDARNGRAGGATLAAGAGGRGPGALDAMNMRSSFPIFREDGPNAGLVYLDTAATAQRPAAVLDAVADYYRDDNANVHRGIYDLSRRSTERFEEARRVVADFIGAPDAAEVIWTRGTTEAINLVAATWGAANIGAGDEILLTMMDHHSNVVPWQILAKRVGARLRYLEIDEQGRLRLDELDALLKGPVKLVALNHVSNALGTINPVAEVVARAHDAGAVVVVDGAQGAPHLAVDVNALGCDFYALSGHKMGAPMGIGALWGRQELLESMPPYQGGGEMIDTVLPDESTWAELPHKYEAGTPNVGGAVGMAAAVAFLRGLGPQEVRDHESSLVAYGLERLRRMDGLRLFGPEDPGERIAVFSFTLEGVHPHDVATILDAEGIAVRAGHHCTQPLMRRLGVPATTRASCWVYNSTDDLDRLAEGLEKAKEMFG